MRLHNGWPSLHTTGAYCRTADCTAVRQGLETEQNNPCQLRKDQLPISQSPFRPRAYNTATRTDSAIVAFAEVRDHI